MWCHGLPATSSHMMVGAAQCSRHSFIIILAVAAVKAALLVYSSHSSTTAAACCCARLVRVEGRPTWSSRVSSVHYTSSELGIPNFLLPSFYGLLGSFWYMPLLYSSYYSMKKLFFQEYIQKCIVIFMRTDHGLKLTLYTPFS